MISMLSSNGALKTLGKQLLPISIKFLLKKIIGKIKLLKTISMFFFRLFGLVKK